MSSLDDSLNDLSKRVDELKNEVIRLERLVSNINKPISLWPVCLFGSIAMLSIPLIAYVVDKK